MEDTGDRVQGTDRTGANSMGKVQDDNLTQGFDVREEEALMEVKVGSSGKEGVVEDVAMVTSTTEWTTGGETQEGVRLLERKDSTVKIAANPQND